MSKCYVYSNETGKQVASYEGEFFEDALALAEADYSTNDYHMSDCDMPVSNGL